MQQGGYSQQCSPKTPYRCELGDLNGKQARYDIGSGKKYFLDVNTPLFGVTSGKHLFRNFHVLTSRIIFNV